METRIHSDRVLLLQTNKERIGAKLRVILSIYMQLKKGACDFPESAFAVPSSVENVDTGA
jgi:hypothetical protein